ncbi:hypothetical protein HDF23_000376 [Mucilaginibacter lappiensis]|uniref:Uncharacterized protein n=1 Tax=Mucilaginibacter lappiensis TaxID=354630 RepID=A0ABR6PD58_9SPHI|nr:hypothetical protein [Mucilaginibacter lappiensis]MBB6107646.1 hypothetical protein [Mucilaginibacter lappiensis]
MSWILAHSPREAIANHNGTKIPDRKEVYNKGGEADKSYHQNALISSISYGEA